jgi:hypothetical protein
MEDRVVDGLRKVDGGSTGNVMDQSAPRTEFLIGERAHISKTVSDADVELFAPQRENSCARSTVALRAL